jgi:hypothetical protein
MQFSECVHIREGVYELLQAIRSEADLIIQDVVMCRPCCPLPTTSTFTAQLDENTHFITIINFEGR